MEGLGIKGLGIKNIDTMRRIVFAAVTFILHSSFFTLHSAAQTDVTSKIDNPNFEARFAGWENNGMLFQENNNFYKKNGMVYMEKWVNKGSKVPDVSMKQEVQKLQTGTYTLVAGAQNIQQESTAQQTGAYLFAGNEQVAVSDSAQYSITFTVIEGKATIGFKTVSATGNWVAVDNFRLYYNGVNKDSINLEMQKLITEAESVLGSGDTADELQTAINNAKALLTTEGDYEAAAKALTRATLNYRISNATGSTPIVKTGEFVPTGVTLALGRSSIGGTGIKEKGFCWSTEPNPTVLDNRSTRYFSNNGYIYCMEHMEPATVYYVRAYAMTNGYKVGYGDVVKIATLPESNMTVWYDYEGDEMTDNRIASAVNEVYWLYHNLTNVRDFNLSVHYSPGSGAGGGTADCSYGGYMRVSQNTPYQQTGTILHETNHGVGVGTTNEWYNNSNLRAETSRGLWLGPRANKMVQFLENSSTATLTGDNTHMWPYGINGAHEDAYNPENTILYYANAMTTHALHQDGLICSCNVGFATPAYVFQQDDEQKYYIVSENENAKGFLTMNSSGTLMVADFNTENSDNFAWNITYDPKTSYYIFRNVGTGMYISKSRTIKGMSRTAPTTYEKFHLLPGRAEATVGNITGQGYWITMGYSATLQANTAGAGNTSTASLDFANTATSQRWLFLNESQVTEYNKSALELELEELYALISKIETTAATPHMAKAEGNDVETIDNELNTTISTIRNAKYNETAEITTAIADLKTAFLTFMGKVTPTDISNPFDITFMINNPGLDNDCDGWNTSTTNKYSCCEFFETAYDLNQTTQKMPSGTYELRVQAFMRPGTADAAYTAYNDGTVTTVAQAYIRSKSVRIKNIWADAQESSLGGNTQEKDGLYIPDDLYAASRWFAAGHYDNSALVSIAGTTGATIKLGIKCTTKNTAYWTAFDNFRLYYYGSYSTNDVTGVDDIEQAETDKVVYDLMGRRIAKPIRGLYIVNGRKTIIK